MAKKLDLSTSRKADPYGDFTRNYRQSENVEDRRTSAAIESVRELRNPRYTIPERDPGRTPNDPRNNRGTGTANQSGGTSSPTTPSDDLVTMRADQARKMEPEEALRRTGNR